MALKYSYYVGIFRDNGVLVFVTHIDCVTKFARWQQGCPAIEFTLSGAKELQKGLLCNGHNAVVVTAPPYLKFENK